MLERLAAVSPALIKIADTPPMDAQENLEMLMALYQEGDLAAATALIRSISPKLYRFFAAQEVSRGEADDLLQETWLRIHKVRHTYRTGRAGDRVVLCHRAPRAGGSLPEGDADHQSASANWTRWRGPRHRGGANDELEALLAPLSSGEREVVEMLKVEGLSLEEVARATSSTVGSVKQKAHRAYKKLREAFGFSKKKTEAPH